MFVCPNCRGLLRHVQSNEGRFWACPSCDGRAVTLAVLRRNVAREHITHLWHEARYGKGSRGKRCPACRGLMAEVSTPTRPVDLKLDVCVICHIVWFDPNEYDAVAMKSIRMSTQRDRLSADARKSLAMAEIELMRKRGEVSANHSQGPDDAWQYIPALFGMPVEVGLNAVSRRPLATWFLVVVITIIGIATFQQLERVVRDLGFLPGDPWRHGGLTMLTAFFLHAGWLHLIGNMYFLFVFGDNVEDILGIGRYLLMIFLAAAAGNLLHMLVDPRPDVPCIGASGGISGVLAFYALRFPRARLGMFFRFLYWFTLPVYAWFGFWIVMQVLMSMQQVAGFGSVSAMAHLGGAAVGFLFWLRYRNE